MTSALTPPLADTSDMVSLHRVFRDAFSTAVALIGSTPTDNPERVELVGSYYDNVLRLLHVHHEGEDELLTPRLVARCTPAETQEVERVAAQHHRVLNAIRMAEMALAEWRAHPTLDSAADASTALVTLGADLCEHLDDEERTVLPIAGRYIFAPEWGEMPAHGMSHFTGDKIWLILGLIREQMTPGQLADMDEHMPPPARQFWESQGESLFTGYVAELRA